MIVSQTGELYVSMWWLAAQSKHQSTTTTITNKCQIHFQLKKQQQQQTNDIVTRNSYTYIYWDWRLPFRMCYECMKLNISRVWLLLRYTYNMCLVCDEQRMKQTNKKTTTSTAAASTWYGIWFVLTHLNREVHARRNHNGIALFCLQRQWEERKRGRGVEMKR